ncbi:MAG: imidazolonepropionase [Muribaculaceae bacterium]|nr:imidazolonepropionase [Muribaculaceae bacterium]
MIISRLRAVCGVVEPHVRRLAGADMLSGFRTVENAWLRIDDGRIVGLGTMDTMPAPGSGEEHIVAEGAVAVPAFADSHTHIVYAGSRHGEFVDKIRGMSYEEIAARGGGILNSADRLRQCSEDELFSQSVARLREVMDKGTGAIEIKTGYGLDTPSELKMLRVIARLAEATPVRVRATWLGAHAVGREYAGRPDDYVDMLVTDMLPAIAAEGVADYVDVFCDAGFFTPAQTARILEAAAHYGMKPKIHANELAVSGGVQTAVAHHAVSADHLERIDTAEIALLGLSDTIATMLPGASFFLGMPYAPARRAVDSGCTVALASDYNPGSSPSGDMRMVWALGCIKMKLLPMEALCACTLNGAAAMELSDSYGAIAPGRPANFILSRPVPAPEFIPYSYTTPWIDRIFLGNNIIKQ